MMSKPFSYPKQKILDTISRIPESDLKVYPKHVYEPERIEIARELALKEFYKLFPFLHPDDFEKMDDAMIEWFDGKKSKVAPVQDYWNFVGGAPLSLRLKNIRPFLTSQNITWKLEQLDPKSISLYWAVGTLSEFTQGAHDRHFSYEFVKKHIIDDPKEYADNVKISDEKSAETVVYRDHYPVIVLRRMDGSLELLDGNRRVMRAWLQDKAEVNVWVGSVQAEPAIHNHWVGADTLRALILQYNENPTAEVYASVRSQLNLLFQTSLIAKHHYQSRCLHINGAQKLIEGL